MSSSFGRLVEGVGNPVHRRRRAAAGRPPGHGELLHHAGVARSRSRAARCCRGGPIHPEAVQVRSVVRVHGDLEVQVMARGSGRGTFRARGDVPNVFGARVMAWGVGCGVPTSVGLE